MTMTKGQCLTCDRWAKLGRAGQCKRCRDNTPSTENIETHAIAETLTNGQIGASYLWPPTKGTIMIRSQSDHETDFEYLLSSVHLFHELPPPTLGIRLYCFDPNKILIEDHTIGGQRSFTIRRHSRDLVTLGLCAFLAALIRERQSFACTRCEWIALDCACPDGPARNCARNSDNSEDGDDAEYRQEILLTFEKKRS